MFKRRSLSAPVDYLHRGKDRRKLTNYLRTGRFKKIAGSRTVGGEAFSRRLGLFIIAGAILAAGLFHALL